SVRLRIFSDFIDTLSSLSVRCLALHKRGAQRQLVRSEPHCFLGFDWRHAFHLEQNLARTNHGYPVIRSSLTFTHTGFSRLLGHGLVREQANPDFAAPLDETSHCHAARFDLPVGNPAGLKDFQPILPESERAAAPGFAGHAAALLLAVLHFLWHQHKISSRFSVVRKASRWKRLPSEFFTSKTRRQFPAVASLHVSFAAKFRRGKSSTSRQSRRRWYALR